MADTQIAEFARVVRLARDFADGRISAVELHQLLSARTTPIASDLEGDLWGLVFEVGDGDIDLEAARRWVTEKYGLEMAPARSETEVSIDTCSEELRSQMSADPEFMLAIRQGYAEGLRGEGIPVERYFKDRGIS